MSHHFREMRVGDYLGVKGPEACTSISNVYIFELFSGLHAFLFLEANLCPLEGGDFAPHYFFFRCILGKLDYASFILHWVGFLRSHILGEKWGLLLLL